ncbi:MAG: 50S ribosomal protein L32 [Candidatus Liptonbacteria bacterium]|nr:50S ribosomal protein L32 [Candidatus Liptonbacteria bacterium]
MPPVKHHTRSKVGRRRANLRKKNQKLSTCLKCKGPLKPHCVCLNCGFYKT